MIRRILFRHPKSVELDLRSERSSDVPHGGPQFTVIIGKNGTMKSAILGEIARYHAGFRPSPNVRIESDTSEGTPARAARVFAFSSVLNDKFPLPARPSGRKANASTDRGGYFYFGPRRSWNGSSGQRIRAIFEALLVSDEVDQARTNLLETLLEVGFHPSIELEVLVDEVWSKASESDVRRLVEEAISREFSQGVTVDRSRSDISEIVDDVSRALSASPPRAKRFNLILDLTISQGVAGFRRKIRAMLWGQRLGIFRLRNVSMFSTDLRTRNVSQLSSGEANLVLQILAVASTVVDGSVILVDEPETSLHPEWQMRYVRILQALLRKQTSCMVYLATHSPFILSSLPESNSTVIALESVQEGVIDSRMLEVNTFGWSVEHLLFDIFHVRTFRNSYLDAELRMLISDTESRDMHAGRAIERVNILRRHVHGESDPLGTILNRVEAVLRGENLNGSER